MSHDFDFVSFWRNTFGGKRMDRDHDRDDHTIAGFSVAIRIDPEQYRAITRRLDDQTAKLDILLAQLSEEEKAKLASVTADLKKSGDELTAAVAQDQPQP